MNLAFLDLETYSLCDLRQYGGRIYANDPSTRIMCACLWVNGGYQLWLPSDCGEVAWPLGIPEEPLIEYRQPECPWNFDGMMVVAHNGDDFDFQVWRALGLPAIASTFDTLPCARAAGYPGALDALSTMFLGIPKNEIAVRMLKRVCKSDKPPLPGQLAVIASYNIADVAALRRIYEKVSGFLEEPLYSVHKSINDRGILFDRVFAGMVLRLANENVKRAGAEIERLTSGYLRPTDLTKRNRVLEWCRRSGLELQNLRRDTVEALLDDPDAYAEALTSAEETTC